MTLLLPALALLVPSSAPQGGHATHHPPGAVLFLEVPDVPAAFEAYGRSALFQTLNDPTLHAAIGRMMGEESVDPVALLMAKYREAVEQGDLPPIKELVLDPLRSLSISVSVPGGQVLPLVAEVMGGNISEEALLGQIGVQVEVELADPAAARRLLELIEQAVESSGDRLVVTEVGDALVARVGSPDRVEAALSLVIQDSTLCALFGAEQPGSWLARVAGDAPGLVFEQPKAFRGTGTTILRLQSTLGEQLLSMPELAQVGPLIELAEGLVGPPLTMLVRGGKWRVGVDDKGRFITEGLNPQPTHDLDRVLASQPLDPSAYGLVHPDAIVGWVVHFDSTPLVALIEAQFEGSGEDPLAQVQAEYGFHPIDDLLKPLGNALAYSLPEPKTLIASPPLMVTADLGDRAAFLRGMDGLGQLLRVESGGSARLSTSEYRGVRLYALEMNWNEVGVPSSLPIDLSAFFKPTLAVCENRVFLTTLPNHAKREIRRLLSGQSAVHPVLAGDIPEGCTSVGFANWMRFVGKLYTAGRAMAPMIAMGMGEKLPFDLSALPPADLITGRFSTSRRWKTLHGDQVLHYQESSFGPEIPMLLGLGIGGALFAAGSQSSQVMVAPEAIMAGREEGLPSGARANWLQAHDRATGLRVAAQVFKFDQGRWPKNLAELEKSTSNYPDGYLSGRPVGADPWGGEYHLGIEDDRAVVWSDGPDGVDDGGTDDDVVAR
jgi:hypothetical protein